MGSFEQGFSYSVPCMAIIQRKFCVPAAVLERRCVLVPNQAECPLYNFHYLSSISRSREACWRRSYQPSWRSQLLIHRPICAALCTLVCILSVILQHRQTDPDAISLPCYAHICAIRLRRTILLDLYVTGCGVHDDTETDQGDYTEYAAYGNVPSGRAHVFEYGHI